MKKENEKQYSGTERREFERIPFSVHVHFMPCGKDKDNLLIGGMPGYSYSSNISIGGIQLQSNVKPKLDEYIKLQLTIPKDKGEQVIDALGQVIWFQYNEEDETFTAGVKFVELKESSRKILKEFIGGSFHID